MAGSVIGVGEERVRELMYLRCLLGARLSLQQLDARQDAAILVLPAAARGDHLFQKERAIAYLRVVPAQLEEAAQRAEGRGSEDTAGAQPAACRHGGVERQADAAAKPAQLRCQGRKVLRAVLWGKARQTEGCLGDGEGRVYMGIVGELLVGGHLLGGL